MNAVMVHGDAVGTTLYYGKGAGSEPTASAVISDLVDLARVSGASASNAPSTAPSTAPLLAFQPASVQPAAILPIGQVITSFYLRLRVQDVAGVLAKVTAILAEQGISIDALIQHEAKDGESQTDLIILTHDCPESQMDEALKGVGALVSVVGPVVKIRKEELA
jgi:homoserine dehydrogenase